MFQNLKYEEKVIDDKFITLYFLRKTNYYYN